MPNPPPSNAKPPAPLPHAHAHVRLTAELVTTVCLQAPAGDDFARNAYQAAVERIERLLNAALAGHVAAWSWDVQEDHVEIPEAPCSATPQGGAPGVSA